MQINLKNNKDSKLLTDAELRCRIKLNKNTHPKLLLEDIEELSRRQTAKEENIEQYQQHNIKTQRNIKIMTAIILIATIIILFFTVADYFK